MIDDDKRLAAAAAIEEVGPGMCIGLGTGTTAAHAIALLGARIGEGLSITAVATSEASAAAAQAAGITVLDFAGVSTVDLTIDGADEIDARFHAIKGGGGAMVREKIVAAASRRMVVIADGSKRVGRLGGAPVPVEVLPFALSFAMAELGRLASRIDLRRRNGAPFRTDNGNVIIDVAIGPLHDAPGTARLIDSIPGVVGHGLFIGEVDAMYIADGGVVTRLERVDASK